RPLWAIIDVYGSSRAVKFVHPLAPVQSTPSIAQRRLVPSVSILPCYSYDTSDDDQGSVFEKMPSIMFHSVHSMCMTRSVDGSSVHMLNSSCNGVVFSDRMILSGEGVHFIWEDLGGCKLRFGLTNADPELIRGSELLLTQCTSNLGLLANPRSYFTKALLDQYSVQGNLVEFVITENGEMQYSINGEDKGIFLDCIDTSNPLWIIVELNGRTTAAGPETRLPSLQLSAGVGGATISDSETTHMARPRLVAKRRHTVPASLAPAKSSQASSESMSSSTMSDDCKVCFEAPLNAVFDSCGHMCTCYECAMK
ncbi:hypothetical protein PENTCL1PPCAC_10495, partial [Pristionchus entomophagus]